MGQRLHDAGRVLCHAAHHDVGEQGVRLRIVAIALDRPQRQVARRRRVARREPRAPQRDLRGRTGPRHDLRSGVELRHPHRVAHRLLDDPEPVHADLVARVALEIEAQRREGGVELLGQHHGLGHLLVVVRRAAQVVQAVAADLEEVDRPALRALEREARRQEVRAQAAVGVGPAHQRPIRHLPAQEAGDAAPEDGGARRQPRVALLELGEIELDAVHCAIEVEAVDVGLDAPGARAGVELVELPAGLGAPGEQRDQAHRDDAGEP